MSDQIDKKIIIMSTIEDLVSDFLFYNRKGDEELPLGLIEEEIKNGNITIDEIVEKFKSGIEVKLKGVGL